MSLSKRVKMIVGGVCNLIVIVTFALILVVLSENRVVHRVLAAASGNVAELNSNQVVLSTHDLGSFVGKKELVSPDDPNEVQRTFFAFRGISYASPPIGGLRWEAPQPVELKSTPHQASDFKPPCSQWSPTKNKVIGVPDCLYLNIYTSYIPSSTKRRISNFTSWTVENPNLLPVLVYVHGGDFISGSASRYSPDALMKREHVVLVTFNYRLGSLGFLSSGDEHLPGNYGLMDQIAALRWIQKYIHRFGGNPLRVTIFGSVEYLLLANTSMGTDGSGEVGNDNQELFHGAILKPQTISVLSPFAKVDSRNGAKNYLKHFADNIGCSRNSSEMDAIMECLRNADTDSLIRTQLKLQTFHNIPFSRLKSGPLGPVVDDKLLDDTPENLFSAGKFHEGPIMVGLSANEGFNLLLEFYLKLYRKNIKNTPKAEDTDEMSTIPGKQNLTSVLVEEDVRNLLQSILETVMVATPDMETDGAFERVFQSIWDYYFKGIKSWENQMESVVQKLLRFLGDMFVNTGHCKLLHALSVNSKAPVYSYVFNHGSSKFPEFFTMTRELFEKSLIPSPKIPKRSSYVALDTPWDETFYLFHPIRDGNNFPKPPKVNPWDSEEEELPEDDRNLVDALSKLWVSFARHTEPKQAIMELKDYGNWTKMEPRQKSLNYYLLGNSPLLRGMRSDFRKAECQFWMTTVPQVRTLSKVIQDLEPFPILFWSSVAVVILFLLIIVTLIVLIVCVKRTGSYGGDGIYLHNTRQIQYK